MSDWATHSAQLERVFSPDFGLSDVVPHLDGLVRPGMSVHFLLLGVRPRMALVKLPRGRRGTAEFRVVAETPSVLVYSATSHHPRHTEHPNIVFRLDVGENERVATLTTVAPNAVCRSVVERYCRAAYPRLFSLFLRQRDMRAAHDHFQAELARDEKIMLKEVSQLRRLAASVSRRLFTTERAWTDTPYAEAFDAAREQVVAFRRTRFEVCRMRRDQPRPIGVEGSVAVDAHLTVTARVRPFYDTALRTALAAVRTESDLAQDRARRPDAAVASAVLAKLEDPVEQEHLPRLGAILRKMPRTSVSIVHGNPYLHARLVDFTDGSSFDLMLVTPTELVIVPQLRATEGAVTRLCRYIYEHVGEAEFSDAAGSEPAA